MLGGVYGEGDGPEAVVMRSLGMVEEDLPRLAELVPLDVELVVERLVEGDVEDGPEAPGIALLSLAARANSQRKFKN